MNEVAVALDTLAEANVLIIVLSEFFQTLRRYYLPISMEILQFCFFSLTLNFRRVPAKIFHRVFAKAVRDPYFAANKDAQFSTLDLLQFRHNLDGAGTTAYDTDLLVLEIVLLIPGC